MKKQYIKIQAIDDSAYYVDELSNMKMTVAEFLNGIDTDDGFIISIVELEEEDFKNADEFRGF